MRKGVHRATTRWRAVAAVVLLGSTLGGIAAPATASPSSPSGRPAFAAHGSVEQVYATGVRPSARVALLDHRGATVATRRANSLGGVLFRGVAPGEGYRVRPQGGAASPPLEVLPPDAAPPNLDVYDQTLPTHGYGYLTTRDGTKLAIDVHLPTDVLDALPIPGGVKIPQQLRDALNSVALNGLRLPGDIQLPQLPVGGPYPTLIEYGGYGFADPAGPQNGIATVANLMGFAVVDVNMRGTGCSGGAFDFFEPLQDLDGYDVIETVARQPWVLHHKVGMLGISYGGISQLFTAQLNPPSLAAISPLSVIDSTQTTLYPGGILNTGFALAWAKERVHDALPASPTGGQKWAYDKIQHGDTICKANQALHPEAVDLLAKIKANSHYVASVADPLAPITFVHKIKVPVFLACQWEDEQTGGHCPDLASHFTGTDNKWFTFTNGFHIDSLDPVTFNRWYDFLELFVAKQPPIYNTALIKATAPLVYQTAMGIDGLSLPDDPVQGALTYKRALAMFKQLPPVRVVFDNGAGGSKPGLPYPTSERSFATFPPRSTRAETWYLSSGGALTNSRPTRAAADGFTWDAGARPLTDYAGADPWQALPAFTWRQAPKGSAVSYVTSPLAQDTTVVGAGRVDVWVRSSSPNVDLQATISEVRPDGKETFVQNGWVRTSERALDGSKSTLLQPVLSLRASDTSAMPKGRYVKVTIPLYYQGHQYRAGSRIRVTITAPNGDQPVWSFAVTSPTGTAHVAIAHSPSMPSQLVLPVIPGVVPKAGLPPCPGLRGEPCRPYVAIANRPA
jgi:predicted acyl esterase